MNAHKPRALDRSAPLNAFKTVAGFREEKICFEGEQRQCKTQPKGKTFTAESPHRLWSNWKKASGLGFALGMLNTPPVESRVHCVSTASPTRESIFCRFGCQ